MVMASKKAEKRCKRANSQPKMRIQIILSKRLPILVLASIRLPKGKRPKFPILKHWIPKGMPTTVIQSRSPTKVQLSQDQSPANKNQMIFPSVFIVIPPRMFLQTSVLNEL